MTDAIIQGDYMKHRVKFRLQSRVLRQRTDAWAVYSSTKPFLGWVKWDPLWRSYCFFPADVTMYDSECLREISDFMGEKTLARKAQWKLERSSL